MRRLQANFDRALFLADSFEQNELSGPTRINHQFTHKKSLKENPIQQIPIHKINTSTRTRHNFMSKQSSTKKKVTRKKSKKSISYKNMSENSLNSVLEHPITSKDKNIQGMFHLFCQEKKYKVVVLKRIFNSWYRKMTRKLLLKILKLKQAQDEIMNSLSQYGYNASNNNNHVETSTQFTQTEILSNSESDHLFEMSDDPEAYEVQDLTNKQLIKLVKRKPVKQSYNGVYRNSFNDAINDSNNNSSKNSKNNDSTFLAWTAESITRETLNQSCDLVANLLENPMSSSNSQADSETTEDYIPIPISSDHSETIDNLNIFNSRSKDDINSDSYSQENSYNIDQDKSIDNNLDLLDDAEYSEDANTTEDLQFSDSLSDNSEIKVFKDDDKNAMTQRFSPADLGLNFNLNLNSVLNLNFDSRPNLNPTNEINEKLNNNINESQKALQIEEAKSKPPQKNEIPLKEKFRPPPINPNAEVIKPVSNVGSAEKSEVSSTKENEQKKFMRQFFSRSLFEAVKSAQLNHHPLPKISIPPTTQKPWQFTEEYCDLIVDVVTEITESTNIIEYDYEEYLEFLSNFFVRGHYQRSKTVLPELEKFRQKRYDNFLLENAFNVSDVILSAQLHDIIGS